MTSNISMSRQLRRRRPSSTGLDKGKTSSGEATQSLSADADSIEGLLASWRRERPDLDPWPFAIFGRVWRLSTSLLGDTERYLKPIGLTFESFSVIVTLRRAGPPFELNPTALYRESLLSSGAITNRIDRVEIDGLVKRLPDPNDRRGTIVRLTPKGVTLADRAIKLHFEALAKSLAGIDHTERQQLSKLLAKLLLSIEQQRFADRKSESKRK